MKNTCTYNAKTLRGIAIIIPAFNPDNRLLKLIHQLSNSGAEDIIVVDDGSKAECREVFEAIKSIKKCIVLRHAVNLGKGRALKTAFNYFLNYFKGYTGLVTVDADGQHKYEDILRVAKMLGDYPTSLILGTRNFNKQNIPLRSKIGNLITSKVFYFFSGIDISDTQTGLRGISYNNVLSLIKINGEKYEFEMNTLVECSQKNIDIKEVNIETIYIDENKSSHFNPLRDSIRIYSVFIKFIFSSFSSFIVDILSFILFVKLFSIILPNNFILMATIGSRIVSSLFNYVVNHKIVFLLKDYEGNQIAKYYLLALVQMFISAFGVSLLYNNYHHGEIIIKMLVDSLLFITSFRIQRGWVFRCEK